MFKVSHQRFARALFGFLHMNGCIFILPDSQSLCSEVSGIAYVALCLPVLRPSLMLYGSFGNKGVLVILGFARFYYDGVST